jgi:hypothetical protein
MSTPITDCMVAKACTSENGYVDMLKAMRINISSPCFSIYHDPCPHAPKCFTTMPTPEQIDALNARLRNDLKDAPR